MASLRNFIDSKRLADLESVVPLIQPAFLQLSQWRQRNDHELNSHHDHEPTFENLLLTAMIAIHKSEPVEGKKPKIAQQVQSQIENITTVLENVGTAALTRRNDEIVHEAEQRLIQILQTYISPLAAKSNPSGPIEEVGGKELMHTLRLCGGEENAKAPQLAPIDATALQTAASNIYKCKSCALRIVAPSRGSSFTLALLARSHVMASRSQASRDALFKCCFCRAVGILVCADSAEGLLDHMYGEHKSDVDSMEYLYNTRYPGRVAMQRKVKDPLQAAAQGEAQSDEKPAFETKASNDGGFIPLPLLEELDPDEEEKNESRPSSLLGEASTIAPTPNEGRCETKCRDSWDDLFSFDDKFAELQDVVDVSNGSETYLVDVEF